ncbi:MAG: hypothetical protein K2N94_10800, partial [Lachnospiraceae bacterium]|nr:hypothetical protein [Lachnospiraceae bacterium]
SRPVVLALVDSDPEEKETAEAEYIADQAEELAGSMREDDYRAQASERFKVAGCNLQRLARALERIKAGREQRETANAAFLEKKRTEREAIEKTARRILSDQPAAAYLADLFARADIPVTEAKLRELAGAAERGIEAVGALDGAAGAYLISNRLEPSIQNLYRAVHSGSSRREQPLPEQVWEELRPSAEAVVRQAGLEPDGAAMENARWLLENELPLTAENLAYKEELDRLSDLAKMAADGARGSAQAVSELVSTVLERAVEAMQNGLPAEQAQLAQGGAAAVETRTAEQARAAFARILPETVDAAAARLRADGGRQELSLDFLQRVQRELSGRSAGAAYTDVAARRQLAEIQLKLTTEAGVRLMKQGIRLDTAGLGEIVEGLRDLEQEYYRRLYEEAGGRIDGDTQADLALLRETDTAVEELRTAPAQVLSVTFFTRTTETVHSLHETGNRLEEQYRRAEESYEALMTKPRADMGDSIQTAFRNVDERLAAMGLEATEANRRAVRMLSYNQLELTEENLAAMKQYDAQVQDMLESMNPAACARMIQRGINPLDMPLPELSRTLRQLRDEEGASTDEKFSSYLVKLDAKKELSSEEREAYIGIYRLLHQVARTDGAAVGALAGSGRELTLSGLLSAVRTRRKGGVDASVDDEFGGAEAVSRGGKSILEQIEAAYQQTMAERAERELTPEALAAAGGPQEALELTPEQLAERLAQARGSEACEAEAEQYAQTMLGELVQTASGSAAEQAFLAAYREEQSMDSIRAARELLSGRSVYRTLKSLAERYGAAFDEPTDGLDSMENSEKMRSAVENWNETADKMIDRIFGNTALTGEDSMQLLAMRGAIRLAGSLAGKEFYEIPLSAERGFVKLNLTVMHSGGEKGSASIRMAGEGEDAVFELRLEGKQLNCYASSASAQELDRIRGREEELQKALKEQGFEITHWNYGLKTRSADTAAQWGGAARETAADSAGADRTRTDDLYLAAKTIIKGIVTERTGAEHEN